MKFIFHFYVADLPLYRTGCWDSNCCKRILLQSQTELINDLYSLQVLCFCLTRHFICTYTRHLSARLRRNVTVSVICLTVFIKRIFFRQLSKFIKRSDESWALIVVIVVVIRSLLNLRNADTYIPLSLLLYNVHKNYATFRAIDAFELRRHDLHAQRCVTHCHTCMPR